jgi:hypothetical protein
VTNNTTWSQTTRRLAGALVAAIQRRSSSNRWQRITESLPLTVGCHLSNARDAALKKEIQCLKERRR